MFGRPSQRRYQSTIFGEVVGLRAEELFQLDDRAVCVFDANAIACRTRIAARSAIDIGGGSASAHVPK